MKKRGAGQKEGEGQDKSGIVFKIWRIILRRTRRERNRDKEEPVYDCVIYGFFLFSVRTCVLHQSEKYSEMF